MKRDYKFEDAIKRLEEITEKLEQGDLTLEKALSLYDEGIKL
ncbi:MAG: exodeoxyribonuclease VII small subunit, partial [Thermoanaerobacterales bacterium]|nr:exodeoxyribonuclease VII small subunit [Thermoanaerobacterales bacterium]